MDMVREWDQKEKDMVEKLKAEHKAEMDREIALAVHKAEEEAGKHVKAECGKVRRTMLAAWGMSGNVARAWTGEGGWGVLGVLLERC